MRKRAAGKVSYDNTGRVVVVTGSSRGIGASIAEQFARSGASVVGMDIQRGEETDQGGSLHFRQGDTSEPDDCRHVLHWTMENFGGVDVLVNNAAIQPPDSYKPVDQYEDDLWNQMVDVNFTGYMNMARATLPFMQQQASGVIVNMASGQGHRTTRGVPAYGPIKAANLMQARQWAVEYARQGIRVVSVSPGAIDTPMVRATLEQQGGIGELANRHPLGRIGLVEEVAAAVLWLTSSDASFVTGADLEVDGGLGAFGAFADPFDPSETAN